MKAEGPGDRADWARQVANEIRKQRNARSKEIAQANGTPIAPSSEKFLPHQLAAAHKAAMELLSHAPLDPSAIAKAKRVNAAARCIAAYQPAHTGAIGQGQRGYSGGDWQH